MYSILNSKYLDVYFSAAWSALSLRRVSEIWVRIDLGQWNRGVVVGNRCVVVGNRGVVVGNRGVVVVIYLNYCC